MKVGIENLQMSYGKRKVLDIPALEIADGKMAALWGDNGAGKSTLLRILAGVLPGWTGKIDYGGKACGSYLKGVTLVHQTPYMFNCSVRENIGYPLRLRKEPEKEIVRRTDEWMRVLGIDALAERNARRLSGGETQKTALARAFAAEPELLLLDEATAGIDLASMSCIEEALRTYRAQKHATILFSTHSREQALRLADCVICLDKGKVRAENEFFTDRVYSTGD
ncbi:energy-coupling factor ABC transporter ATP-binding protein [Agathobaculum sp.]|uniref:energy-coupling factor ABC transporter ATP-binding protein n=1 Tax=Agathobaculum sp. TaxID=2048138 RepID=UPI002A821CBD|nr:ATP-binding cassette domain-containing protein [Agathobaculum sp.]MDY3618689.1 ATP-binding cassette domain-containing protein [Agathobaculum sp.]